MLLVQHTVCPPRIKTTLGLVLRGNWMLLKEENEQPPVTSRNLERSKQKQEFVGIKLEERDCF